MPFALRAQLIVIYANNFSWQIEPIDYVSFSMAFIMEHASRGQGASLVAVTMSWRRLECAVVYIAFREVSSADSTEDHAPSAMSK